MTAPNLIPKEQLSAYERWELEQLCMRRGHRGPSLVDDSGQVGEDPASRRGSKVIGGA